MTYNIVLDPLRKLKYLWIGQLRKRKIKDLVSKREASPDAFDFESFKESVMGFIGSKQEERNSQKYRYSQTSQSVSLYASAYACMTRSILGKGPDLSASDRAAWIDYFDSFQNCSDGLFYDPALVNDIYAESDWWGARHLALHMISAYTDLGGRPRHPFYFLEPYYDEGFVQSWLSQYDWGSAAIGKEDPDNKIMNIGCLLQYQRDAWDDPKAGAALEFIKAYLKQQINPSTGMWGGFNPQDKHQRSRMVQFAYHLFPIFFYDGDFSFNAERIVELVLQTQNRFGGYGVALNSSACEDIDSIDILIRFHPYVNKDLQERIDVSLRSAMSWVLANQVNDGGFVFRLYESFRYGSDNTSSKSNEGAMFPTWFRTLSLAYMTRFLSIENGFVVTRCPGYEF